MKPRSLMFKPQVIKNDSRHWCRVVSRSFFLHWKCPCGVFLRSELFSLRDEGVEILVFTSFFIVPRCSAAHQAQLIQMVVWMLQRRLLIQLHTYVCLLVPPSEDEPGLRDEDPPLAARVGGRSLSTPSALSFGSPST